MVIIGCARIEVVSAACRALNRFANPVYGAQVEVEFSRMLQNFAAELADKLSTEKVLLEVSVWERSVVVEDGKNVRASYRTLSILKHDLRWLYVSFVE